MHKLPSLLSALFIPLVGLSLMLCFSLRSGTGPALLSSVDTSETRQLKPAHFNTSRLIMLRGQYRNYERYRRHLQMARMLPDERVWRERTQTAVQLYNEVADDTDPSAFAMTSLPRHLSN